MTGFLGLMPRTIQELIRLLHAFACHVSLKKGSLWGLFKHQTTSSSNKFFQRVLRACLRMWRISQKRKLVWLVQTPNHEFFQQNCLSMPLHVTNVKIQPAWNTWKITVSRCHLSVCKSRWGARFFWSVQRRTQQIWFHTGSYLFPKQTQFTSGALIVISAFSLAYSPLHVP